MEKIKLKVRIIKGDEIRIFTREGWLIEHRYDKEINLALVRKDWEYFNHGHWVLIEIATGLPMLESFRTRKEAITWLENAYQSGGLSLERLKRAIENNLNFINKMISNLPLTEKE